MISKFINLPTLSILLVSTLLSTTLIGGCPVAQTPTVPADAQEEGQATQQPPTTPDDGLDRPIQQPELDTTTSGPGGSVPTGPDSPAEPGDEGGDGGDGQDGSGLVIISVQEPSDPIAVRPGTIVVLQFDLVDLAGSVERGDLLLARDSDSDGKPDDKPELVLPIAIAAGANSVAFDTNQTVGQGLLGEDRFGRFVLGVRVTTISNEAVSAYGSGTITIDGVAPTVTWVGAGSPPRIPIDLDDHLVNRDVVWAVKIQTTDDNSTHSVRVLLDRDQSPESGNEFELVPQTGVEAGTHTFDNPLSAYPAGTYYYYVIVSDGVGGPEPFYPHNPITDDPTRLSITNRLIGEFDLNDLAEEPDNPVDSKGAIMQGFNFNDLAGSSMVSVPDLDGDGDSELMIGARFGKPNLSAFQGSGWGEAYLIYGSGGARLKGVRSLNSVGGAIPGVTFRGIRVPQNSTHTEGLADITVVEDMDGDDLPELAFSFPRVESLSLKSPAPFQHPDLIADIAGMGNLEYDAVDPSGPTWVNNTAQFTRGGIVLVSSHNQLLTNPGQVTRKFDRVLDLHEVGQMFSWMTRASVGPYIFDIGYLGAGCVDCGEPNYPPCDGDDVLATDFTAWLVVWDVWLGGG